MGRCLTSGARGELKDFLHGLRENVDREWRREKHSLEEYRAIGKSFVKEGIISKEDYEKAMKWLPGVDEANDHFHNEATKVLIELHKVVDKIPSCST